MISRRMMRIGCAIALLATARVAHAQERTATVVAGPQYHASDFKQLFLGRDYRELWMTPIEVPVLDLARHAGGLKPDKRGGRQSETLHFAGADGRRYIFRSVDKFLYKAALPADVRHTPAGAIAQDQTSALHPASAVVVSPIQQALGILHPPPRLVVMPDDPRLGEFRELFAGMLGYIEENPNEGKDDTPGFAGSRKVVGAEKFFENIDESPLHQLAVEEYLTARLVDFLVGDTDRGGDQWRFARFDREGGGYLWRPVPRDRDYAFMKADGLLMKLVRPVYPKMEVYGPDNSNLRSLTFMTRDMDRRLLVGLEKREWDRVVATVQARLTDAVLRDAVARMPEEYYALSGEEVLTGLRGRRDSLRRISDLFYHLVAHEAEIHASDEPELAIVEWEPDGVVVRIHLRPAHATDGSGTPYFERRFDPRETSEIRLYMHGGADRVVTRGARVSALTLRVIGGGGDDVLADSTRSGAGNVAFYDHRGKNEFVTRPDTKVSEKPFDHGPAGRPQDLARGEGGDDEGSGENPDADPEGWLRTRIRPEFVQDFGAKRGLRPAFDYREGAGAILGVGYNYRRFGFRHVPTSLFAQVNVLYAIGSGGIGAAGVLEFHPENSKLGLGVRARATQFDNFRFFGFGNGTFYEPDGPNTLVEQDRARLRAYVRRTLPQEGHIEIGPELRYTGRNFQGCPGALTGCPIDLAPGAPVTADPARESHLWAGAGFDAIVRRTDMRAVPRHGIVLLAGGAAYPKALDLASAYAEAHAEARTYVPLSGGNGPRLALRAGGKHLWGDFAVEDAAFLGGRFDLRGFEFNRFAGDAAASGSAELRMPLTRAEFFLRGELGVFALTDVGRVWYDGDSPGGWHSSYGGGFWFATLGRAMSVAYARGEIGQLYISLGMPY